MPQKKLMSASDVLKYIDNKYNYIGIDNKDHVIQLSTWRSWKNEYNRNHQMHPILNEGTQKTKGALYSKSNIGKLIRWKKDSLNQLYLDKTKSPLDSKNFIDKDFANRTPISQIKNMRKLSSSDNDVNNKLRNNIKEQILSYFDLEQIYKDADFVNNSSKKETPQDIKQRLNNPIGYLKPSMIKKYNQLKVDTKKQ